LKSPIAKFIKNHPSPN